jgi:hypothetical protein
MRAIEGVVGRTARMGISIVVGIAMPASWVDLLVCYLTFHIVRGLVCVTDDICLLV